MKQTTRKGVAQCEYPFAAGAPDGEVLTEVKPGKVHYKRAKRTKMHCYLRPYRYLRSSAGTHAKDLLDTWRHSSQLASAAVVSVFADNGPDYSVQSYKVAQNWHRIWRKAGWAKLMIRSYAPDHSALNDKIEAGWAPIRRSLKGAALGRDCEVNADKDHSEAALRRVAEAGLEEMRSKVVGSRLDFR